MWEQHASSLDIDVNKLEDADIENYMLSGKHVYRDSMRNKIFLQNKFGFI